MSGHSGRKHSKFSASGAERWISCSGSVALSEGVEDKESDAAKEGTLAHEILEVTMRARPYGEITFKKNVRWDMIQYAKQATTFIYGKAAEYEGSEVEVENRVYLDFIHPEMFGTYDAAVIQEFGTLHVFDYKFGKGHSVSAVDNLQMAFYALGVAHKFDWNFKEVKSWIIQPRIRGYNGPVFDTYSIPKLKNEIADKFKRGVEAVEKHPDQFKEGRHCYFCKGKAKCPLMNDKKLEQAKSVFTAYE